MRRSIHAAAFAVALVAACHRRPVTPAALEYARSAARLKMYDQAAAEYQLAQRQCHDIKPLRRAREVCRDAYLGEAYVYLHQGDVARAEMAFARQITNAQIDDLGMAEAAFRAGQLAMAHGELEAAAAHFWHAIRVLPQAPFSGEALRLVVRHARANQPRELITHLMAEQAAAPHSALADDMLWWAGDVARELGEARAALAYWDALAKGYPDSPWRDDAMWFAALVVAAQLDAARDTALATYDDLIARLIAIGKTRRVAHLTGSFFTVYLDDAQLLLGQTLRRAHRLDEAAKAFADLPKRYPQSLLRDDALWELAVTLAQLGQSERACAAMASLAAAFPRSKYARPERAPRVCSADVAGTPGHVEALP